MRPQGHPGADRITGSGQAAWGNRGQVCRRRSQRQLGGAGRGDLGGELGREERALHALRDGPAEEPGRTWHRQQSGDRSRACRLAENGDAIGLTAEGPDVVTHPLQRCDLVKQASVGGRAVDLRKALDANAVVERHHDDAPVPREMAAVVFGQAGHTDRVGAAVDPHHHRQPCARAGLGRPDVDRQPVVSRRFPCQAVHAEGGSLRRRRSVRHGLAHPAPSPHRPRGGETQLTDRRRGERDASEDGHTRLPTAAQCPGRGADFGRGPGWCGRCRGHHSFLLCARQERGIAHHRDSITAGPPAELHPELRVLLVRAGLPASLSRPPWRGDRRGLSRR